MNRYLLLILTVSLGLSASVHSAKHDTTLEDGVSLFEISATRPCLATAMLFVGLNPTKSRGGVLRLDGIPTRETIAILTDKTGTTNGTGLVTQQNPYSGAYFFVAIRWKVSILGPGRYFFTTQAEIVDPAGAPIVPRHTIEAMTTAYVTGSSIELMGTPETL
jgi:hypothetical protein